jgi:hypothetical protein
MNIYWRYINDDNFKDNVVLLKEIYPRIDRLGWVPEWFEIIYSDKKGIRIGTKEKLFKRNIRQATEEEISLILK